MEKEKIVFDYVFEKNDYCPYDILGTLSFVYGKPIIENGSVRIDEMGSTAIAIRSNKMRNTLGQFVVNYLEHEYPQALILSKDDYAISMGLSVDKKKLTKCWKRNFRRHKVNMFFNKLKVKLMGAKVK